MMRGVRASSMRIESTLVDEGEGVAALDHVLDAVLHVVAEIVEAELVVLPVGHVRVVGHLPLGVVQLVLDAAHGQAEEPVDLAHPLGVAPGEVVVHRDHVHALARQGVQVGRQRRDEGLALARFHLGDLALVEDDPADELDVEVAHAQRPLGRLAGRGEGFRKEFVERLLDRTLLFEHLGKARLKVGGSWPEAPGRSEPRAWAPRR